MIRTWMIFGLLSLALVGNAQETFFHFVRPASLGYYVKERPGTEEFRVMGLGAYATFDNYCVADDISEQGFSSNEFVFEIDSFFTTETFHTSYFENGQGQVCAAGQVSPELQGLLICFDEFMEDTIFVTRPVRFNGRDTHFRSAVSTVGGSYVITAGFQPVPLRNSIRVFEVNLNLGEFMQWNVDITDTDDDMFPLHIDRTPDDGYVITASRVTSPGGYITVHSEVHKISASGELEWSVMPGDHENFWTEPGATVVLEDGSIMTFHTSEYEIFPNTDQPNPDNTIYFEKYSDQGVLLNSGNYLNHIENEIEGSQAFIYKVYQVQLLIDGNLLVSGENFREGFLMKVTPDGEYIWHRHYSPVENLQEVFDWHTTRFYGVFPSSDGGFLCTGEFFSTPFDQFPNGIQTSILVKLDEHGCLEEGCEGPNGLIDFDAGASDALSRLELWPNPVQAGTSTSLSVRVPSEVEIERVEVIDMLGRMSDCSFLISETSASHQKLEIRNQEWASGLYSVMVTTRDGMRYSGKFIVE